MNPGLVTDRKSTISCLGNKNVLPVNQMATQNKLTEVCKASNGPQYSIKLKTRDTQENTIETRSITRGDLIKVGRSKRGKKRFPCDGAKLGTRRALT